MEGMARGSGRYRRRARWANSLRAAGEYQGYQKSDPEPFQGPIQGLSDQEREANRLNAPLLPKGTYPVRPRGQRRKFLKTES